VKGEAVKSRQYRVYPVLSDELNEGIIWVRDFNLYAKLSGTRSIVRITAARKRIHSEALHADARYLERWRDNLDDRMEKQVGSSADLEKRRADLKAHQAEFQKSLEQSGSADPLVFMSKWHRVRLGLCPDGAPCTAMLSVEVGDSPRTMLWQFRVGLEHPQVAVYLATALAIVGIGLGFIALGLGFLALPNDLWEAAKPTFRVLGPLFIAVGGIVFIRGLWSLIRRHR
jgi:hypothetical protein